MWRWMAGRFGARFIWMCFCFMAVFSSSKLHFQMLLATTTALKSQAWVCCNWVWLSSASLLNCEVSDHFYFSVKIMDRQQFLYIPWWCFALATTFEMDRWVQDIAKCVSTNFFPSPTVIFCFAGHWSPDARVWVRTRKPHHCSQSNRKRESQREWKWTEGQPSSSGRGTVGQSLPATLFNPALTVR